ncbi:pyridoxal phosphate-dependent decarboxylase family protein [Micromonospora sp. WMMA1923]|uniref:pyridoxal phosphate-dependent decarboxylase family protein n=1 Tax=Micromonospora sp. WMMA1923 TaxID=3404125 RepID=UPI003B95A2DC
MTVSGQPVGATTARAHLFNDGSVAQYRRILASGVDRVATRVAGVDRPFTGISPDRLAGEVDAVDLDTPLGEPTAALDELEELYLRDAVWFHHPRYLAHLNCPVVIPALLGEAILSAVNSSVDTWDQSAGATLIERRLIDWTAGRIGLGPAADGVFTSGGTQSNLQALLIAREEAITSAIARAGTGPARAGAAGPDRSPATLGPTVGPATVGTARAELLPRLRILASAAGHFSVQKSATLLGLAPDAVVTVPTDATRRMDPAALAREVERCQRQGLVVMAVVATAGTTDFGSIDPLPAIADVCATTGVRLHVDAAYGCGLLVSPTRRHLLDGIERADSVTVDYHKSFFQPVSSSALLVRDGTTLRHATYHADYLNPARAVAERIPNQVDKSLQTTRRFDALKLWLTLRIMGADALGELFDEVVDRAAEAWRMLDADPRFQVVTRSQLSTVVFRWQPTGETDELVDGLDGPDAAGAELVDAANRYARQALAASGAGMVAGTVVDGRQYLKFTLLNPETTGSDIAYVLDLVAAHARRYVREHRPAALTCPVG